MAGLFLTREAHPGAADAALATARAQFGRHGFTGLQELRFPGWVLLHAPYIVGGPALIAQEANGDFAVAAGTLSYDGLTGPAALRKLLAEAKPPQLDWSKLAGQFALVLHRGGTTFIATDFFAAFQLYHDADFSLFSTSFLTAATVLPRVTFDPQGLYEYAIQASVLGDDTVLAELKRLGPNQIVELDAQGARTHAVAKDLPEAPTSAPIADRLATHAALLREVVAEQASHFGDAIQCPLSGGLDSRLVYAVLRSLGCQPQVYVYGWPISEDVKIAQAIGAAEGFRVEWIDKDAYRDISPDEFPEQVARNFEENDGLPNFGGLFDNGGNSYARDRRHRDGALTISGGAGEIYRDFFFLPDRRLRVADVADSFFARYDRRDMTQAFDGGRFLRRIRDKMLHSLGRPGDTSALPRTLIEQLYPRFRGQSLFGRELSVEARYSPYTFPFLDQRVVAEAMTLPMPLKRAGVFEAQLLNAIDPVLAARPSAYGHHFGEPPSRRHRFDEWATRVRPVWLRKNSYAIQRRLKPMGDEHGGLHSDEYMGRVVDLDYPHMRRWFQVDQVTDSGLKRRIALLEYFAAHLGSRLAL
jgi:asparagine synthase (glutamine-hydrolysing)